MRQSIRGAVRRSCSALALAAALLAAPVAQAAGYQAPERLVGPAPFLGVHGVAVDDDGRIYAGSVTGASLSVVERDSGKVSVLIGPPEGMADDIAIAPDGTMAWTGFLTGKLYARKGDGPIRLLAEGLPGINSLAFDKQGRLFATQVFLGDALYEIDVNGERPPRKIKEGMGGLNGFEISPDGWLYGPLWFKGQVVKVNVDSGELQVVAEGFQTPAAANFGPDGMLYVVDTRSGELVRVDPASGAKTVVAQLATSLDNLAIDRAGTIFVSNMADNAIQEVDPKTGKVRTIVKSDLAAPTGLAMVGDTLYVADTFAYRTVDVRTGKVTDVKRMQASDLEYPGYASADAEVVVLSSWFTGTVQVIDRASGETRDMMHGFAAPLGAVRLADGSLLVAELGSGSLLRVSGAHGAERKPVLQQLQGPAGLALSPKGDVVYLTEAAGRVSAVNTKDWSVRTIVEGLKLPEGIALTPEGRLVVAEVGAQRIVEIDPKDGRLSVVADKLPVGLPGLPGLPPTNLFTGVAVSAKGDIYFTSDLEGALYRIARK